MSAHTKWTWLLLAAGVTAAVGGLVAYAVATPTTGPVHQGLLWIAVTVVPGIAIGAVTFVRRPGHASARRLVAVTSLVAIAEAAGGVYVVAGDTVPAWLLALAGQLGFVGAIVAITRLLATYPEGGVEHPVERAVLSWSWALLAVPVLVTVANADVVDPAMGYGGDFGSHPQPFHLPALSALGPLSAGLYQATQLAVVAGTVALLLRYRRGGTGRRQRIRWLLLPLVAVPLLIVLGLVLDAVPGGAGPKELVDAAWVLLMPVTFAALSLGIVRQGTVQVDLVLRRSLVYGALWTLIGVVYVGMSAALGLAAAARVPVGAAVLLTIGVTLAFQPARRWLERVADAWVFGHRLSRYEALRSLTRTLEAPVAIDEALSRVATAVRGAVGARGVRVEIDDGTGPRTVTAGDAPDGSADQAVPVVDGDEEIGRIECFRGRRPLDDADRELLDELARQTALGVSVRRLNVQLQHHVAALDARGRELEESRVRLVRAQDDERRRIERDLHDGVQQEVVVLMARLGLARRHLDRDPTAAARTLEELYAGLTGLLRSIRDLAHGIHPTVLTDRGLVAAVEAQAERCPIPVSVRVDPGLRSTRFPPEVEGAAYFLVTEGLTNVLKHAGAHTAEVSLGRTNGCIDVVVADDGRGFDPGTQDGSGLAKLEERLAALGGSLAVRSRPGSGVRVHGRLSLAEDGSSRG